MRQIQTRLYIGYTCVPSLSRSPLLVTSIIEEDGDSLDAETWRHILSHPTGITSLWGSRWVDKAKRAPPRTSGSGRSDSNNGRDIMLRHAVWARAINGRVRKQKEVFGKKLFMVDCPARWKRQTELWLKGPSPPTVGSKRKAFRYILAVGRKEGNP